MLLWPELISCFISKWDIKRHFLKFFTQVLWNKTTIFTRPGIAAEKLDTAFLISGFLLTTGFQSWITKKACTKVFQSSFWQNTNPLKIKSCHIWFCLRDFIQWIPNSSNKDITFHKPIKQASLKAWAMESCHWLMCKTDSFHNRLYVLLSFASVLFSFGYALFLFGYVIFSFGYVLFTFKLCALSFGYVFYSFRCVTVLFGYELFSFGYVLFSFRYVLFPLFALFMRSFHALFLCALFMHSLYSLILCAPFMRSFHVLFLCAVLMCSFHALFVFALFMCCFNALFLCAFCIRSFYAVFVCALSIPSLNALFLWRLSRCMRIEELKVSQ